jgi:hypothetical protein
MTMKMISTTSSTSISGVTLQKASRNPQRGARNHHQRVLRQSFLCPPPTLDNRFEKMFRDYAKLALPDGRVSETWCQKPARKQGLLMMEKHLSRIDQERKELSVDSRSRGNRRHAGKYSPLRRSEMKSFRFFGDNPGANSEL